MMALAFPSRSLETTNSPIRTVAAASGAALVMLISRVTVSPPETFSISDAVV
jgi:hypothetical protein